MAAKHGSRETGSKVELLSEEQRWAVVRAESGKRCYLASEQGLTRSEAEAQAQSLNVETEVVPVAALDRYGRLDRSRLEEALAETVSQ